MKRSGGLGADAAKAGACGLRLGRGKFAKVVHCLKREELLPLTLS